MITEDYVSFETAKLLKEKGFDYYPDGSYWLIDANNVMYWVSEIGAYDYVDVPTESFQRPKNGYRIVTQAMAMKWLREVHHYYIQVMLDSWACGGHTGYYVVIQKTDSDFEMMLQDALDEVFYKTYEEACEAAIKYCLEKLI